MAIRHIVAAPLSLGGMGLVVTLHSSACGAPAPGASAEPDAGAANDSGSSSGSGNSGSSSSGSSSSGSSGGGSPDSGGDANRSDAGHDSGGDGESDADASASVPRIEAWIFPGDPACNAPDEYRDGRHIDVLKPEYYRLTDTGDLQQETVATDGCNAYSAANAADVRQYSTKQLFTVSGSGAQLTPMVASSSKRAAVESTLVAFAQQIGFSGVDIDFEGLTASVYPGYLTFIQELGTALHAQGLQLEIDVTAYANAGDESLDAFRYEDAVPLPVDGIVVMAYDFMTDYAADGAKGAGDPIAPMDWVGQVVDWAFSKVGDKSRVVIGMPSYGYSGMTGSTNVTRDPSSTFTALPGASGAQEFPNAFETTWSSAGTSYVFITASELDSHRAYLVSKGVTAISVWHLGGNAWFTH